MRLRSGTSFPRPFRAAPLRAAVHELAHQALGLDNVAYLDNRTDTDSYEHANADRPSQYYGELRWTTAWPVLQQKFGRE